MSSDCWARPWDLSSEGCTQFPAPPRPVCWYSGAGELVLWAWVWVCDEVWDSMSVACKWCVSDGFEIEMFEREDREGLM